MISSEDQKIIEAAVKKKRRKKKGIKFGAICFFVFMGMFFLAAEDWIWAGYQEEPGGYSEMVFGNLRVTGSGNFSQCVIINNVTNICDWEVWMYNQTSSGGTTLAVVGTMIQGNRTVLALADTGNFSLLMTNMGSSVLGNKTDNLTNVAFLNNTQTFTGNNTFNGNITLLNYICNQSTCYNIENFLGGGGGDLTSAMGNNTYALKIWLRDYMNFTQGGSAIQGNRSIIEQMIESNRTLIYTAFTSADTGNFSLLMTNFGLSMAGNRSIIESMIESNRTLIYTSFGAADIGNFSLLMDNMNSAIQGNKTGSYNATYDQTTREWDGNKSALIGSVNNASYLSTYNDSYVLYTGANDNVDIGEYNFTAARINVTAGIGSTTMDGRGYIIASDGETGFFSPDEQNYIAFDVSGAVTDESAIVCSNGSSQLLCRFINSIWINGNLTVDELWCNTTDCYTFEQLLNNTMALTSAEANLTYVKINNVSTYNESYNRVMLEWDGNKSALLGAVNNASYLQTDNSSYVLQNATYYAMLNSINASFNESTVRTFVNASWTEALARTIFNTTWIESLARTIFPDFAWVGSSIQGNRTDLANADTGNFSLLTTNYGSADIGNRSLLDAMILGNRTDLANADVSNRTALYSAIAGNKTALTNVAFLNNTQTWTANQTMNNITMSNTGNYICMNPACTMFICSNSTTLVISNNVSGLTC